MHQMHKYTIHDMKASPNPLKSPTSLQGNLLLTAQGAAHYIPFYASIYEYYRHLPLVLR